MKKKIWKWLLAILLLAAVIFAVLKSGLWDFFSDGERLRAWISGAGVWAPLAFFALQTAQVIVAPIPGNVTTLAGGALFGFWPAFGISSAAVIVGSCLCFGLSRRFGLPLVRRFVPEATLTKYEGLLKGRSGPLLALMFLMPFFPDDMLCFVAGLAPISWPGFVVLALLTRPWGLLFASLLGSGAFTLPLWAWIPILAATAALFVLGAKYGPTLEEKLLKWMKRKNAG